MEKIDRNLIDDSFEKVYLNNLNDYQKSNPNYQPTHYSLTLQKNGFDKVEYFRKKVDSS